MKPKDYLEHMDGIQAGQLLIVTHGPFIQQRLMQNPFTGEVTQAPRARNEQLVGAIFEVLDVSLPFLAVKPRTSIRNSNATGVIDCRSGIRFKQVTEQFLSHLEPKPKPPQQPSGIIGIRGLPPETTFEIEEAYGVTPTEPLEGCGNPNCLGCNPSYAQKEDEDEDEDEDGCGDDD